MDRAKLAALFNQRFGYQVSTDGMKATCLRFGLHTGRTGKYPKGNVPFNTGTKGFMKPNSGNFRKGYCPKNHMAVGSEALTTGDKYVRVKVAEPNVWEFKHVQVWTKANGPVPAGHTILFLDGDHNNCELDNFKLIPRSLLMRLNQLQYGSAPPHLMPMVLATAELQMKTGEALRMRHSKRKTKAPSRGQHASASSDCSPTDPATRRMTREGD